MNLQERLETASRLARNGQLFISNGKRKPRDVATLRAGLIQVESKFPIVHPYYGYKLDNPMTWDTFTHIYLLNKGNWP